MSQGFALAFAAVTVPYLGYLVAYAFGSLGFRRWASLRYTYRLGIAVPLIIAFVIFGLALWYETDLSFSLEYPWVANPETEMVMMLGVAIPETESRQASLAADFVYPSLVWLGFAVFLGRTLFSPGRRVNKIIVLLFMALLAWQIWSNYAYLGAVWNRSW